MNLSDYESWLDELVAKFGRIPRYLHRGYSEPTYSYGQTEAQAWASEAGAALASAFPPAHSCCRTWDRLAPNMQPKMAYGATLEEMLGVVKAAAQQFKDGRVGKQLVDVVRAETEDELLDQALALLGTNHVAAAAIITGGALETHLRHLASKASLVVVGDGSISKYDAAIAKARNDGTISIYSATDSKSVLAWGGLRNDAAHSPGTFQHSRDDVRRMVDGIRAFIASTT